MGWPRYFPGRRFIASSPHRHSEVYPSGNRGAQTADQRHALASMALPGIWVRRHQLSARCRRALHCSSVHHVLLIGSRWACCRGPRGADVCNDSFDIVHLANLGSRLGWRTVPYLRRIILDQRRCPPWGQSRCAGRKLNQEPRRCGLTCRNRNCRCVNRIGCRELRKATFRCILTTKSGVFC